MTCPNPKCARAIPDDSLFCDQCGKELFRCTKCEALAIGKFCTKDGARTVSLSTAAPQMAPVTPPPSTPILPPPYRSEVPALPNGESHTVRIPIPQAAAPVLKLIHAGGSVLSCPAGIILGRKVGPHASYLVSFDTISGQHGKIEFENGVWHYVDIGSTNGSRVNGQACSAQTPYAIKAGDVLELANQKFEVE